MTLVTWLDCRWTWNFGCEGVSTDEPQSMAGHLFDDPYPWGDRISGVLAFLLSYCNWRRDAKRAFVVAARRCPRKLVDPCSIRPDVLDLYGGWRRIMADSTAIVDLF